MDLKEIRYMLSIFRNGSITKAAAELYISQPALSKYLKNVEAEVGSPLFSRIGNEMIPTHAGSRYLSYAEQIAALRDDWEDECADLAGESKGSLTVAIPLTRGSCIMPDVLSKFHRRYPDIRIGLAEESHSVEKLLLSSREIDLVVYNDIAPDPALVHRELAREEVVLVTAADHPLASQGMREEGCRHPWIDLALTGNESFVLHPPEQTTGRISAALLASAGIKPDILLRTRNTEMAVRIAANGTALAFCPESYLGNIQFDRQPACFSVGKPKAETVLYAVYRKDRYLPSYAGYFLDLVEERMKELLS